MNKSLRKVIEHKEYRITLKLTHAMLQRLRILQKALLSMDRRWKMPIFMGDQFAVTQDHPGHQDQQELLILAL